MKNEEQDPEFRISLIKTLLPRVALVDIVMPELNGLLQICNRSHRLAWNTRLFNSEIEI